MPLLLIAYYCVYAARLGRTARGLWTRREAASDAEVHRRLVALGEFTRAMGGRSAVQVAIGRAPNAAPSVGRRADPELRVLLEQLWLGRSPD